MLHRLDRIELLSAARAPRRALVDELALLVGEAERWVVAEGEGAERGAAAVERLCAALEELSPSVIPLARATGMIEAWKVGASLACFGRAQGRARVVAPIAVVAVAFRISFGLLARAGRMVTPRRS